MTSSRAMSAAPTGTKTAFSAMSVARAIGVFNSLLASADALAAVVRARVFVLRAAVVRALAPALAARVPAAFLAAVERFVAFVLRVAAALTPAVSRVVCVGVG